MIWRRVSVAVVVVVTATVVQPVGAGAQRQVTCGGEVATIVGTSGSDFLEGTPGRDVIAGLGGRDFIDGLAGDDIICGGKGGDLLIGSDGFDTIFGGNGNDTIWAGGQQFTLPPQLVQDVSGNRIIAGKGHDTVIGSNRRDIIEGGPGNDHLLGLAGRDRISGGSGADQIAGHEGRDNLQGGKGSDVILGERRDTVVRGGGGEDFCPALPNTASWRGCDLPIFVDLNDSTLPALSLPEELSGGRADTYVYYGESQGTVTFVGTSTDLRLAVQDDRFELISAVTIRPVTNGQANAIAQYLLETNPSFINQTNFLNPGAAGFGDALDWGFEYLLINGLT